MNNKRKYLIFEDTQKDPSLKPYFDACAQVVLDGTARAAKTRAEKGYPRYDCFRAQGREVLAGDLLTYYLHQLGVTGFDYGKAREFSERMRALRGFPHDVYYPLKLWVHRCLRDPYFYNTAKKDDFHENWTLKQGIAHDSIPEDFFRSACYIAICHMKYGASYESVTANEIFRFVTELGSDLPAKLKKNGSGDLPKEITEYRGAGLSCKANDAFATIEITMKEETETYYGKTFDFLCALPGAEFPRSYSIDFRSPEKNILPVKGLPKRGVHHLFANAIRYTSLHGKIERYARLVMKEFEWYTNLEGEKCAMPGTFAVFALGLCDEKYHALVCDYLTVCDGEHQSIQGQFVLAYIEKYGFTEKGLELYSLCGKNIQHLPEKLMDMYKKRK